MKRTLMRLGAGATAVALAGMPGAANADDGPTVDPDNGPVSYAIPAAFNLPDGTQGGDPTSGVKHMVRSPESPGQVTPPDEAPSKYPYVESLAVSDDPDAANQFIQINDDNRPEGADKDDTYLVGAALQDTTVPVSVINADIGVTSDNTAKTGRPDEPLVYLDNMTSQAACAAPDDVAADTTAENLWMRQPDGSLDSVDLPTDEAKTIEEVPLGMPGVSPEGADSDELYGDVTLTRVTDADQLIKPDDFRLGDHNAATGWRVDIDHYWLHDGEKEDQITSSMLLGAVSCSLPDDFEALSDKDDDNGDKDHTGSSGDGDGDKKDDEVPTRIPSGGGPVDSGDHGIAVGAGAAGAVALGSTGVLAYRRRRALRPTE